MALRFARPGMNIVIGDMNDDAMATVVSEATALGVEVPRSHGRVGLGIMPHWRFCSRAG
jgi:hypothetical protein